MLVRSRAAYRQIVEQFETFDIPVAPGGRTGLFDQPEGDRTREGVLLAKPTSSGVARTNAGSRSRRRRSSRRSRRLPSGSTGMRRTDRAGASRLEGRRCQYRPCREPGGRVLRVAGCARGQGLGSRQPAGRDRLGMLARFTALLADYESVRRRARPDPERRASRSAARTAAPGTTATSRRTSSTTPRGPTKASTARTTSR